MKDTNQFVWMCIGDLHDIADGFDMIPNVQKNIVIEDYEVEEAGKTSVKQAYSKKKRAKYVALLKYIDQALKELFDYIEINYRDACKYVWRSWTRIFAGGRGTISGRGEN